MNSIKAFEYLNVVENLTEQEKIEELAYFIDERLNELFILLKNKISDDITENEFLKHILMNTYSFDYKHKTMYEAGSDVCTLIGLLEAMDILERPE